ncbi:MAG: serine hydrolase domain-containing protein [Acidobacteriota bacterium]
MSCSNRLVARAQCLAVVFVLMSGIPTNGDAQTSTSLPPDTIKKLETIVESEKAKLGIPGLAIAIAVDNRIQYAGSFGLADIENQVPVKNTTAFRTASIAKTFTATAVMQLVEQGKIDLDAPIQKYCPAFPEKNQPITARLLLTHQSGIRHYKNRLESASTTHYSSITESLNAFKDEPLLFEPGAKYSYTTYGYSVLGCAIEGASGMKYEDYMNRFVFQPAGMQHTRVDNHFVIIADRARGYIKAQPSTIPLLPDDIKTQAKAGMILNANLLDTSVKIAGGGQLSTAMDLAKFAIAVNTDKLMKRATREQMWKAYRAKDEKPTGYGFGWSIAETGNLRLVLNNGNQAGAKCELWLFPDKGVVIAVMTNLSDSNLRDMLKNIQDLLLGFATQQ